MKSNVAVAVISLACLVAFFHPCHGLICYMCHSNDYHQENCEKISGDECVHDYGDKADYCVKIVYCKKATPNVTEDRLLIRGGLTNEGYKHMPNIIAAQKERGFEADFFKCNEDRCNGD